jgi:prepilin-type N-terminal cleavage/methylation domain-containing protein
MRTKRYIKGFTLAELLIAMVITGIVLAAAATLAFAMSSSNKSTDDISFKQAQIRFASLRLTELIRHSRLIYSYTAETCSVKIWLDNNRDNIVDNNELVLIEAGAGRDHIKIQYSGEDPVFIVPACSNVQFIFNEAPPRSKNMNIKFEMTENNIIRQYQIDAGLRSWAGNLLNGSNIVSDDD